MSVILETQGHNRFEYAKINNGNLHPHGEWNGTGVIVVRCRIEPSEILLSST